MSDAIDRAIEVATGVTIDWEGLGRAYGEQFPEDQARFLLGMWEMTTDQDAARIARANVLGGHANANRGELAEFLRLLADAIEKGPTP